MAKWQLIIAWILIFLPILIIFSGLQVTDFCYSYFLDFSHWR